MLLYAGTRTNEWLEKSESKSTLLLMGGEAPTSVKELSGQYAHDLIKDAVCAIEVTSRPNGRFTQFMHNRMIKRPNFFNAEKIVGAKSMMWCSIKPSPSYKDKHLVNDFNMSQHYSRLFYDFEADPRYSTEYNFGSESGSNYCMVFEMEKAVHAHSIATIMSFSTSTFYAHVYGGRLTATDYTQVDNTLDLSGATEGQTVRIRDVKNLPADLAATPNLFNGIVAVFTSGKWVAKPMFESFEWVKANVNKMTINTSRDTDVLDDPNWIADKEKFEFYRLDSDAITSFSLKGRMLGFIVEDDDLPDYASLPKQTITWGILIPQNDDSTSSVTYRSEVTGDAPMMLLNAGIPNSGAAATLNNAVNVNHTSDITLMNLKVAINWMEELA